MQRLIFAALLIVAISVPAAFAESNSQNIIDECQTLYPEFESLGKDKFIERYMHQPNIRSCLMLYNDNAWLSDDPDRTDRLIALLNQPLIQKSIRDRADRTGAIPQWIKDDAIRWEQGKEHDNIFTYGLRFLIDSKMIDAPVIVPDQSQCIEDQICVFKDNYIKYSIKNTQTNDVTSLTQTFGTPGKIISIASAEITKKNKTQDNFHIDSDGLIGGTTKYYRFVHKSPVELGTTIQSEYEIKTTSELVFPFKDQKRDAVVAWDKTKQYQEVIDKYTGIVLSAQYNDRIKNTKWSADLVDTNAFSEQTKAQYQKMTIPSWIKEPVKWWSEGRISDSEYLNSISYLIKNKVIQI